MKLNETAVVFISTNPLTGTGAAIAANCICQSAHTNWTGSVVGYLSMVEGLSIIHTTLSEMPVMEIEKNKPMYKAPKVERNSKRKRNPNRWR